MIEKLKPSVFANIFILYQDMFLKGLDLGVGVYDIFDEKIKYIQPYNSGHAPLPGPSRELIVKLSYHLNLKRKEAN